MEASHYHVSTQSQRCLLPAIWTSFGPMHNFIILVKSEVILNDAFHMAEAYVQSLALPSSMT